MYYEIGMDMCLSEIGGNGCQMYFKMAAVMGLHDKFESLLIPIS